MLSPLNGTIPKNDLIAELKLSHNLGGVSKLKNEQSKIKEKKEKQKFEVMLAQFTVENYMDKV